MESSLGEANAKLSGLSQPLIQRVYENKLKKKRKRVDQLSKLLREHFESLTELGMQMSRFEQQCQDIKTINQTAKIALDELSHCESKSSLQEAQNKLQVFLICLIKPVLSCITQSSAFHFLNCAFLEKLFPVI